MNGNGVTAWLRSLVRDPTPEELAALEAEVARCADEKKRHSANQLLKIYKKGFILTFLGCGILTVSAISLKFLLDTLLSNLLPLDRQSSTSNTHWPLWLALWPLITLLIYQDFPRLVRTTCHNPPETPELKEITLVVNLSTLSFASLMFFYWSPPTGQAMVFAGMIASVFGALSAWTLVKTAYAIRRDTHWKDRNFLKYGYIIFPLTSVIAQVDLVHTFFTDYKSQW